MKKILLILLVLYSIKLCGQTTHTDNGISDKIMVLGMIGVGNLIYPEASQILYHYCFGNGSDLILDPSYIKTSPVILNTLKKMKVGDKKIIRFSQKEDWRLSYAFNPMTIEKYKDSVYIHQYIKFDSGKRDYTILNLCGKKIKVYDNIVHTFKCKPFTAKCSFKLNF